MLELPYKDHARMSISMTRTARYFQNIFILHSRLYLYWFTIFMHLPRSHWTKNY